jgi:hypothetical protein
MRSPVNGYGKEAFARYSIRADHYRSEHDRNAKLGEREEASASKSAPQVPKLRRLA